MFADCLRSGSLISTYGVWHGVQSITLDKKVDTPIYDVNGRRLESPQKGINIISGKKVVLK